MKVILIPNIMPNIQFCDDRKKNYNCNPKLGFTFKCSTQEDFRNIYVNDNFMYKFFICGYCLSIHEVQGMQITIHLLLFRKRWLGNQHPYLLACDSRKEKNLHCILNHSEHTKWSGKINLSSWILKVICLMKCWQVIQWWQGCWQWYLKLQQWPWSVVHTTYVSWCMWFFKKQYQTFFYAALMTTLH